MPFLNEYYPKIMTKNLIIILLILILLLLIIRIRIGIIFIFKILQYNTIF